MAIDDVATVNHPQPADRRQQRRLTVGVRLASADDVGERGDRPLDVARRRVVHEREADDTLLRGNTHGIEQAPCVEVPAVRLDAALDEAI